MNILRLDSSLFANDSVSHQLSNQLVEKLTTQDDHIVHRDLAKEGVPHLDSESIAALGTPAEQRTAKQQGIVDYADQQIAQLQAADLLIIAAPMYNFSVPSVLKAWFDHIARAGVTFEYTETGPRGLLKDKQAYIITTRGGLHRGLPSDTQVPFITQFLSFLGIDDIEVIYAEGLNINEQQRAESMSTARTVINNLQTA